jgi:hypothetical protein
VIEAFREAADKPGQPRRAERQEHEDALQRAPEFCRGYASYLGGCNWREHQTTPMSVPITGVCRVPDALMAFATSLMRDLKGSSDANAAWHEAVHRMDTLNDST